MPRSPRARSQSRTRGSGRHYAPAAAGGGGITSPSDLTDKLLWLRAKDLGSGGSNVTNWPDQSGLSNHVTGTGATVAASSTPSGGKSVLFAGQTYLPSVHPGVLLGSVNADSFGFSNQAYLAHDGNSSTFWLSASTALPHWIEHVLRTPTVYTQYTLTPNPTNKVPKDWVIAGSNDHSTWTTLDTRTGILWSGSTPQSFSFSNTTAYLYYRMTVSVTSGGTADVGIGEFTFTGRTAGHQGAEMWVVLKATTTGWPTWHYGVSGTATRHPSTGSVVEDFGMTTSQSYTPTMSTTVFRLRRITLSAAAYNEYLDNVSQKSVATPTLGWLGSVKVIDAMQGNVAEILIRSSISTTDEVTALIAYFNTEHGLTVT